MELHVSSIPWSPERPDALVVVCSDGRFRLHVIEFLMKSVSKRPDLLSLPGGPAVIDPWLSSFDHARIFEQSMRFFLEHHALKSVWLIAHQGCAFYAARYAGLNDEAMHEKQVADLRQARKKVLEFAPGFEVNLVWTGVREGQVIFERQDP